MKDDINVAIINGAFEEKESLKILFQMIGDNLKLNILNFKLGQMKLNIININHVLNCRGCKNCFKKGKCTLDAKDNFAEKKEVLTKSDIIIIYTPVYVDNVSGTVKTFIDRLASWSHNMTLAGKLCVIAITTNNTGIDDVSSYLYKVMSSYGLIVAGFITKTTMSSIQEIQQQVNNVLFRVLYYKKFLKKSSTNFCLENLYNSYSYIYKTLCDNDNFEKKEWERKFGTYSSLQEYIDQN